MRAEMYEKKPADFHALQMRQVGFLPKPLEEVKLIGDGYAAEPLADRNEFFCSLAVIRKEIGALLALPDHTTTLTLRKARFKSGDSSRQRTALSSRVRRNRRNP
jgi:hypothetical protein